MTKYNVLNLKCPGCGSPVLTSEKFCKYCGREIVISTFSSVYSMTTQDINKYVNSYKKVLNEDPDNSIINLSIGMCYLKLRLYDKALKSFEKAIEDNFDNSETYFYAAICLLKGKKAFLTPIADIRKLEDYINAALNIENRGIYNYFLAYIKYDFYYRKSLNTQPTYFEEIEKAKINNVTNADIRFLFQLLNVKKPEIF